MCARVCKRTQPSSAIDSSLTTPACSASPSAHRRLSRPCWMVATHHTTPTCTSKLRCTWHVVAGPYQLCTSFWLQVRCYAAVQIHTFLCSLTWLTVRTHPLFAGANALAKDERGTTCLKQAKSYCVEVLPALEAAAAAHRRSASSARRAAATATATATVAAPAHTISTSSGGAGGGAGAQPAATTAAPSSSKPKAAKHKNRRRRRRRGGKRKQQQQAKGNTRKAS